ncbi:5-oxoprolinase [Mesorhizobium sp. L-8-10]|uniref:hydantoinase B/oxoprolinase family protein n=1 Tax=unclassified Mesorhizobium TaxID=325217 RepID=UPI001927E540|nr:MULTISPECIES: hydantoinase B/oxoprolinase family protein [unclassified Mesorhizobium]BCH24542.1 5-oxoprolinase [Mesorhizobium sp. L-8-3]BCH32275.1 5-oxoprolinase [Mesorhizobium sp. L-8-10]
MDATRTSKPAIDPVTAEIVVGKLLATVDEMGVVMTRSSMSPIVYEVLDFACGICAPNGDLVAQSNGITLFTGTFARQVRAIADRFRDDMEPGDVFVINDPFSGGTHPNDFAIIKPVYSGGRMIAWAINVAHWLDVGGAVPGSIPINATSVFEEGMRIPGVRLARRDRLNDDIVRIILENLRLPDLAMGDLRAQVATVRIAERSLQAMAGKYGEDTLADIFEEIIASSERKSRKVIEALPDGEYEAEDVIDGDGISDKPVPIRIKVTIRGSSVIADFTGSSPSVAGPFNCSRGALESAVKTVFKALVSPHSPSNEGWFRPLEVVVPDGTVFSAGKPSPTGWYYEGSVHASELIWRALAPLKPEVFSAGSYTSLAVLYLSGRTANNELFVHIEPQHGGWGATPSRDGASGLISLTDGDTYNHSVELLEARLPLLITRYGFNTEGGTGAGRFRGGYGLVREYQVLCEEASIYCGISRNVTPPWGADGGSPGSCNGVEVVSAENGGVLRIHHHPGLDIKRGDTVRVISGGGGGWGNPDDRKTECVLADIADGLISQEAARAVYGIETEAVV